MPNVPTLSITPSISTAAPGWARGTMGPGLRRGDEA